MFLESFIKSKTTLVTVAILIFYCGWEIFSFIICEFVFPLSRGFGCSFEYKSFHVELFISLNLTSLAVLYIILPHINRFIEKKFISGTE